MTMWPKQCGCCRAYITEAQWSSFRCLGVMDHDGLVLDYRNCTCTTTLVVVISDSTKALTTVDEGALVRS